MGLDMYLFSFPKIEGLSFEDLLSIETRLSGLEEEDPDLYSKMKDHIQHFEEFGMSWVGIRKEAGYWRKANQIHHWFVENLQDGEDDCGHYEVKKHQASLLYDHCGKVLTDKDKAIEILPTRGGFFFGSTSYDSYYFYELQRTQDILKPLINSDFFEKNYLFYESSW